MARYLPQVGVSEATFHSWKKKYAGLGVTELRELRQLREENGKLRDPQDALGRRLRELAAVHVRWGYRRLTILLQREGWKVNAKRIYRIYVEEGLIVR